MPKIRICNTSQDSFKIQRSYNYNALVIPACEEGQPYTFLDIDDHTDYRVVYTEYDAKKADRIPVTITAKEIVADFFGNEKLAEMGCFVPKKDEPTEKELNAARAARVAYLSKCIQDGDIEYARSQRVDEIPGAWKRYAAELGVERDWAFMAPKASFDCPVCGDKLKVGVALCKSCGAILDKEKAAKFGLLPEKPAKQEAVRVI